MPETNENAEDIAQLPILHTSEIVLLPYENFSLKIATIAHKQLVKDVAHGTKLFVVVFRDKNAAPDHPDTDTIGCVAQLKRIKIASSGGKLAEVMGVGRFLIEDYADTGAIYPVADGSFIEDKHEDEEPLRGLSLEAGKIIRRIINKTRKETERLPEDDTPLFQGNPQMVSFLLADLFDLDSRTRQQYLDFSLTSERLQDCIDRLLSIEAGTDERMTMKQFLTPFYSGKHK